MKSLKLTNETPERIDKAVSATLGISRSKAQKAINAGQVIVLGKEITPHTPVTSSDDIRYDASILEKKKKSLATPTKLDVLYEDDHVIVVNKPAGVLVHETEQSTEPTLVDALLAHAPQIADVGDDPRRAGIVHRLDKAASGVLIVAKTKEAFAFLKQQFQERTTQKKYTVLVRGAMDDPDGTINFPIERSKVHGRMAAKPESQGGKEAVTHWAVLKQYPHHALLDVTIETGRTHQIRAHMFAIGHPVAGDVLYRQRGLKPDDIGRLFLHARELTIPLPNGETKTFVAPLPAELEHVLATIPKI